MITLRADGLTFLGELLAPFPEASTWDWLMADVEAAGDPEGAQRLHEWSDSGNRVPGVDVVGCFGCQIIDGYFQAFEGRGSDAILAITAIRNDWYDVDGRADLIRRLTDSFPSAVVPFRSDPAAGGRNLSTE
jgi:hypothetical protein